MNSLDKIYLKVFGLYPLVYILIAGDKILFGNAASIANHAVHFFIIPLVDGGQYALSFSPESSGAPAGNNPHAAAVNTRHAAIKQMDAVFPKIIRLLSAAWFMVPFT